MTGANYLISDLDFEFHFAAGGGIERNIDLGELRMKQFRITAFLSFLISLTGPVTLVALYAQALVRPEEHAAFIFRAGIATYIVEFLSIHSSGMLSGERKDKHKKKSDRFFLLGFYMIFIVGFMASLHCWFIGLYFILSLCTKVFMSQSVKDDINKSQIAFSAGNLLCCTLIVVALASFLRKAFPFPESILAQHPKGTSRLFVDTPQTLLAWGILYFSCTVVFNTIIFLKHTAQTEKAFQEADVSGK